MYSPGWYPDADVAGQERWWDGAFFTSHVRPVPAPPAALPVPTLAEQGLSGWSSVAPVVPADRPGFLARQREIRADLASGKNTHASVALVCILLTGLGIGLGWFGGVVFGVLGLRRAAQYAAAGHPPLGRWKSIVVLGIAALEVVMVVVALSLREGQPY